MNLSHNKFTHHKVRSIHSSYFDEKKIVSERWVMRRWFDKVLDIVVGVAMIAVLFGAIFGIGCGFYRLSEVSCSHKADKYGVNWSYGLSTRCLYEVDGKWMDSSKYPPTHVKVEK